MDYRLRCRLVGFSILLAAAGALLSGGLQSKKVPPTISRSRDIQIEKAPSGQGEGSRLSPSRGSGLMRTVMPSRANSTPGQSTSREHCSQDIRVQPAPPRVQSANLVIQLGVFRNTAKLSKLIVKLRAAGYMVVTTPMPIVQGQLNWLFILPAGNGGEDLQLMLTKLEKLAGLKGEIKSFTALKNGRH